jgi:hypothetical protein
MKRFMRPQSIIVH